MRFTDLEKRFGEEPTDNELATAFIEDFKLNDNELSLFVGLS
jgi:hypothetical protein